MNSITPDSEATVPMAWWRQRIAALQALLDRHAWLLPAGSFAFGWIGFVLVQRGVELARGVALLAIIGWPWLLIEPVVRRKLQQHKPGRLPVVIVNFISQSLQQELLFFALPWLIGATQLDLGQWIFAALTIAAALISTIDPIYEHHIAKRPGVSLAFHAYCSWVAALVVLPIVAKIPLERALPISLIAIAVWIICAIPKLLASKHSRQEKTLWLFILLLAPPLLWFLRNHIPAAGLSVREAVITRTIENLTPGAPLSKIPENELNQGVVAFVAIRAPMGVAQSVIFEWCHDRQCERIASEIRGTMGYWRTYSRKHVFWKNPQGNWTVDVLTPQGQLLKRMRFEVTAATVAAPSVATPAVTTPAVTTPAVTTPSVTTPAITKPAVTAPAATGSAPP